MTTILGEYAANMRKNPTRAEASLWEAIQRTHPEWKTLFQYPIRHPLQSYIADYYIPDGRLVIEVDGGYHRKVDQLAYDKQRTRYLRQLGMRVFRLTNETVLRDVDAVVRRIDKQLIYARQRPIKPTAQVREHPAAVRAKRTATSARTYRPRRRVY